MVSLFALLSSFIHRTLLLSCQVPGAVLNAGHSERIVLLGCSPGVQTHSAYVLCWKWRPRAWETPRGEGLSPQRDYNRRGNRQHILFSLNTTKDLEFVKSHGDKSLV